MRYKRLLLLYVLMIITALIVTKTLNAMLSRNLSDQPSIYLFIYLFIYFGHPSITIYNHYYQRILSFRCFFFIVACISTHFEQHLSAYYDLYLSDTIYFGLSITRYPLHQGWLISSKSTTQFYLSEIFELIYILQFHVNRFNCIICIVCALFNVCK